MGIDGAFCADEGEASFLILRLDMAYVYLTLGPVGNTFMCETRDGRDKG
jgi:hypothetical protein